MAAAAADVLLCLTAAIIIIIILDVCFLLLIFLYVFSKCCKSSQHFFSLIATSVSILPPLSVENTSVIHLVCCSGELIRCSDAANVMVP